MTTAEVVPEGDERGTGAPARVGLLSQWYDPERGSAAQSGVIARSLTRRGHSVEVVTGFPNYPTGVVYDGYRLRLHQHEQLEGVEVHRTPLYPSHDANALRRSSNYVSYAFSAAAMALATLRDVDVCLVHGTPATAAFPAMVMRWLRSKPYVVHIHDLWPDTVLSSGFLTTWQSKLVSWVLHTYCDAMYRGADAVAVTSPGMSERIQRRGVPADKIHFIPNWADEELFQPVPADPELRRSLGLTAPTTVMYAGNLGEYQDLATVVEAAHLLRDREDIQFVMVGEGVERPRLEALCRQHDLHNVRFLGAWTFSEMPNLLALGDLQLVTLRDLPIFQTTLPSKLVAALASGRPILGGLIGDAAELLTASGAGEVVTPGAPEEFAAAVERFAALAPLDREACAEAGRSYYLEHLNQDTVAAELSAILNSAAVESGGLR